MSTPRDQILKRMEELNWSQADLAYVLGTTTATVNQIINGKRAISMEKAKEIGVALGIDASKLFLLQAKLNLQSAKAPEKDIEIRSRVLSKYPLREMIKRGWIEDTNNPQELEQSICQFFGTTSIAEIPHLSHAAKRTPVESLPPQQLAWVFRVKQIASGFPVPKYSRFKLNGAINKMTEYRGNREEVRLVPKLLYEAGVRYVLVEPLPGSKIDGVCLWLDDDSPVIGMSMRFDRIDNFWFVLRHELAHVLHGHGKDVAIIDAEMEMDDRDESEEERIANAEATDFCVPKNKMDSFYLRKHPMFSEKDILAFAKIQKVHPGLVVGQIQKRLGRYNFLRNYLVPIFDQIEGSALIDGFGHFIPVSE